MLNNPWEKRLGGDSFIVLGGRSWPPAFFSHILPPLAEQ
jgi:hypothetical protein